MATTFTFSSPVSNPRNANIRFRYHDNIAFACMEIDLSIGERTINLQIPVYPLDNACTYVVMPRFDVMYLVNGY